MAKAKQGINISQRMYTMDLLEESMKLGAQPVDTRIEQT